MPAGSPDADIWGEDDNARRYDAFARQHPIYQDTSRDLIALAGLSADAAVVDLACGTGITSREILAALGPNGKVTGAINLRQCTLWPPAPSPTLAPPGSRPTPRTLTGT